MSLLEVRRSLLIKAPREAVWEAIADPSKFFNRIMGAQIAETPAPERTVKADFGEGYETLISFVAVDPPRRLAFRWHYEAMPVDQPFKAATSTLVTFELFEEEGGTRLDFLETGFENLPDEIRQISFEQVSLGWPGILDTLASIVSRGGDAWLLVRAGGRIDASPDRVWDAIIALQFFTQLQSCQGHVEPGRRIALDFGADSAVIEILVVEVEPGHKLSYRWSHQSGQPFREDQSTLVCLEVVPYKDGGAWVAITESQFDRIPEALRNSIFEQMTEGWKEAASHLNHILSQEKP